MPQFFFHLHNDVDAADNEGTQLPGLAAAKAEAVVGVRELIADEIKRSGRINLGHSVEIADERGERVSLIYFRDCVEIVD